MSDLPDPEMMRTTCIAQTLRRAARAATRRYEAALRPLGLTIGQFTLLAALDRPEPMPRGVLADALGMDRTTLTRDVAPLERRGLVLSAPMKDDGRARGLSLTPTGRGLLAGAAPAWAAAQARAEADLGASWPDLKAMLARL